MHVFAETHPRQSCSSSGGARRREGGGGGRAAAGRRSRRALSSVRLLTLGQKRIGNNELSPNEVAQVGPTVYGGGSGVESIALSWGRSVETCELNVKTLRNMRALTAAASRKATTMASKTGR